MPFSVWILYFTFYVQFQYEATFPNLRNFHYLISFSANVKLLGVATKKLFEEMLKFLTSNKYVKYNMYISTYNDPLCFLYYNHIGFKNLAMNKVLSQLYLL